MASSASGVQGVVMFRIFIPCLALGLSSASATPALAQHVCFTAEETREHVQRHQLVALTDVVRSTRGEQRADLISARLCETDGKLVYMIAMLDRGGKVRRLTVDARSGDVIHRR
jgi:uncharacterized membrane protein YkoI